MYHSLLLLSYCVFLAMSCVCVCSLSTACFSVPLRSFQDLSSQLPPGGMRRTSSCLKVSGGSTLFTFINCMNDMVSLGGCCQDEICTQGNYRLIDSRSAGPILRINPNEIHIDDPEFFEKLYTQSSGYDKPGSIQYRFGSPYAAFSTPEHDIHRARRTAILPFFSKKRITQQTPLIQDKVDRLCSRLAKEFAGTNKVVVLNHLFNCYVADVVTKYAFNKCYDFLDKPDFQSPFTAAVRGFKDIVHPCAQFPWLPRVVKELPDSLIMLIQPSMASVIQFQQVNMHHSPFTLQSNLHVGNENSHSRRSIRT